MKAALPTNLPPSPPLNRILYSYLGSNALIFNDNGALGEGKVYHTQDGVWEERDVVEKRRLMGYKAGETATPGVTSNQHAIRVGAFLYASQA